MKAWSILLGCADGQQTKALKELDAILSQIELEKDLLARSKAIENRYRERIKAFDNSISQSADIQLFRVSLSQILRVIRQIEVGLKELSLKKVKAQKKVKLAEIERQKFQKLIEREASAADHLMQKSTQAELDDLALQMFGRKKPLA